MKQLLLIITLILISSFNILNAQDQIYKRNNEVIECKIIKIDTKVIQYSQEQYNKGVTLSIDKSEVRKIVYESGEELVFPRVTYSGTNVTSSPDISKDYLLQKKNIFKFEFFSPLLGSLAFGYEHSLGISKSVEIGAGAIGIGTKYYENAQGGYFRAGLKFIRPPQIYEDYGSGGHILKGSFIKPEIAFSYFTYTDMYYPNYQNIQQDAYSVAFLINAGKQWILRDTYSVSWSFGLGYAVSSSEGWYYSHITGGNDFPIAASIHFSFGFLY